jgi:hypothetical protein
MKLLYISYNNQPQNVLIFLLGEKPGKICGIISEAIPEACSKAILTHLTWLDALDGPGIYTWFKNNWPSVVTAGYREYLISKTTIHRTIELPYASQESKPEKCSEKGQKGPDSGQTYETN